MCLPGLDNTGIADFRISFTLTTTETGLTLALVNQRGVCSPTGPFWTITLSPSGGIIAENTDASGNHAIVEAGDSVNDGQPHQIVVERKNGLLGYYDDGALRSATVADSAVDFAVLPHVNVGTDPCPSDTALAGHGTLTALCITSP